MFSQREKRQVNTIIIRPENGPEIREYVPVTKAKERIIDGISHFNLVGFDCDIYRCTAKTGEYSYHHTLFAR